jgi:hypothetical protein
MKKLMVWLEVLANCTEKFAPYLVIAFLLISAALWQWQSAKAAAAFTGIIGVLFWGFSALLSAKFDPQPPVGKVAEDPTLILGYLNDIYVQIAAISDVLKPISHLNAWAAFFTGISVTLTVLSN